MSSATPPPPGPGMSPQQPIPGASSSASAPSYGASAPAPGAAPGMPPAPGASAPYGQPPAKKGGATKWILIGLAALLALCCCGGGAAFLIAKQINDGPKEAVTTFMDAVADGDKAEACSVVDPALFQSVGGCETALAGAGDTSGAVDKGSTNISSSSVTNDTATVQASYTQKGAPKTATFSLKKIDGSWKISNVEGVS